MYVISPSADSAEVKELARLWRSGGGAAGSAFRTVKMGGKEVRLPLLDVCSVCALLVWQPADPAEPVTRLLFPGSAPQHKVLEGLEKLRHLDVLRAAVCTAKSTGHSSAPQKSPVKSKSMSSPRHAAPAPAPEPPAVKAALARKEKPKEANNKDADGALKSAARPAKAKIEAGRTGSVELRPKKTETKAPAAKPPLKKEPVNGEAKTPPAQKIKKDAANLKVAESRVHSFKSPLKRSEEPKGKKADDNKEAAPKATRAQSLAREKRSASAARAPEDEKKPKAVKKAAPKEGSAEPPSSPARKPAPKAAKPAAPKAAPAKEAKKEKPKAAPKPPAARPAPSKPSKEPAAKDPAAKAVKRPVKKPVVIATAAAAAVAAVVAADSVAESTTSEEQPVVEEAFTATEVAPAASAPVEARSEDVARDEADVLASIEDQIVSAAAEETEGQVQEEEAGEEEAAVANEDGDGEQEEAETVTEEQADEDEGEKAEAEEAAAEEADVEAEDAEEEESAEQEDAEADESADNEVEAGEPEEAAPVEAADAPDAPDVPDAADVDEEIDDGEAIEKAETEETEETEETRETGEQEVDEAHADESDPAKSSPASPVAEDAHAIEAAEPVESTDAPAQAECETTEEPAVEAEATENEEPADREMDAQIEDAEVRPTEAASHDPMHEEAANERKEDAAHQVEQDEASDIERAQDVPDEEDSIGQGQSGEVFSGESESQPDEKSPGAPETSNDEANQAPEAGASPAPHIEQELAEAAESIEEPRGVHEAPEESLTVGGEAPGAERKASTGESDAARVDSPCREEEEEVAVDDRDVEVDRSIGSIVEAERDARVHDGAQELPPSPKAFESEGVDEEETRKEEAAITAAPIPRADDNDDGIDEEEFVAVRVVRKTPDLPDTVELDTPEEPVALKPVIPAPVKPTVPVTPQPSTQEDDGDEVVEVFQKEIAKPRDFAVPFVPTDEETAAMVAALQLVAETEEKCEKVEKAEEKDETRGAAPVDAHKSDDKSPSKDKDMKSAHPVDEVDACLVPAHTPSKFEDTASPKQEERDGKQEKDAEQADEAVEERFEKADVKHVEAAMPSEPENQNEKRDSVHEEPASRRDSRLSTGSANTQQSDVECDEPVIEEVFHSKASSQAVESEKPAKSPEPSSDAVDKLEQLESAENFVEYSLKSELEEVIETVTSKIEETFEAAKKLLDHKQEEKEEVTAASRDDIRDSNNDDRVEDEKAFESEPESLDARASDAHSGDKPEQTPGIACKDILKQTQVYEVEQQIEKEIAVEKVIEEHFDDSGKKAIVEPPKSPTYSETSLGMNLEETNDTDKSEVLEEDYVVHADLSFSEKPALTEASSGKAQDIACDRRLSESDTHHESTQDALSLSAEETEQLPSPVVTQSKVPEIYHEKEMHLEVQTESSRVQHSADKDVESEADHFEKTTVETAKTDSTQHDKTAPVKAEEDLEAEQGKAVEKPPQEEKAAHEVTHEPLIPMSTSESSRDAVEPRSPKSDLPQHFDLEEKPDDEIAEVQFSEKTKVQEVKEEPRKQEIFIEHEKIIKDSKKDEAHELPKEQDITEEREKEENREESEYTQSSCLPVTKEVADKGAKEEIHEEPKKQDVIAELKKELVHEEPKEEEVREDIKEEEFHGIVKKDQLFEEPKKEVSVELKKEEAREEPKKDVHDEPMKQELIEDAKPTEKEVFEVANKQDIIATEAKKEEAQEEVKEREIALQPKKQEIFEEPEKSQSNEKPKAVELEEEPKKKEIVEVPQESEVSKITFEIAASTEPKKQEETVEVPSLPMALKQSNEKSETFETLHKGTEAVPESPKLIEHVESRILEQAAGAPSVDQHVDLREKGQVHYLESPPKSPAPLPKDNDGKTSESEKTSDAHHLVKSETEIVERFEAVSAHAVECNEPKSPFEPLTVDTDYEPVVHEETRKKSIGYEDQCHVRETLSAPYLETEVYIESSEEQAITAQNFEPKIETETQSPGSLDYHPASPSAKSHNFDESVGKNPTLISHEEKHDTVLVHDDRTEFTTSKITAEETVLLTKTISHTDVDSDKTQYALVKPPATPEGIEKTFAKSEAKVEEVMKESEPRKEEVKVEKIEQTMTTPTAKSEEHTSLEAEEVVTQYKESLKETAVIESDSELSTVNALISKANLDVSARTSIELAVDEETVVQMFHESTLGKHSPSPSSPLQTSFINPVIEVKPADIKGDTLEALSKQSSISVPPPVQMDNEWPEPEVVKGTIYSPPDTASSPIDGPDDSRANFFPGVSSIAEDKVDMKHDMDASGLARDERIPSPITQDILNTLQDQTTASEPLQEEADLAKSPVKDSVMEPRTVSAEISAAFVEIKTSPNTVESFVNLVKSQVGEVVEAAKEITESVVKSVALPTEEAPAKQEEKIESKEAIIEPKGSTTIVSSLQCDPLANLPVMEVGSVDLKSKSPTDVKKDGKEQLMVDTLDIGHSSAGSSASVTPKSPLSPNIPPASASVAPLVPAQFEDDAKSTSSSLSSSEIAQHAAAEQKPDFRIGQEVDVASMSSKLSTIGSSEAGADFSQPFSMDSNVSSATYDKLMASDRHPLAEESAFSSGPASWDERMMMQDQTPVSHLGTYASDASATSSLTSHTTEDNHPVRQLDQPSMEYVKTAPSEDDASKKDLSIAPSSPVPSSPFSTDCSASHGDFEASKDSLSSIHTSGSSDYHLGREMKADDSSSSVRSDYSASSLDQPKHEERSVTPRSDISSASETTMRPIIQSITEQTTEAKAAKVELADPKVAPHNVWIKEKEAASPNPFSDQFPDDDAEHSEPLVLDVHRGTSELYYQQHLQQQLHSDVESDSQSSIPVAEFTDEYYAQHTMYMEATRPVGQPYDLEAESYSYESDDHQYEAKYGDSYDEADQYPREDELVNRNAPELGDRQNGNSYHYHEDTEISSSTAQQAEVYEDLNRNGHSPVRDPTVQATGNVSATDSATPTTRSVNHLIASFVIAFANSFAM